MSTARKQGATSPWRTDLYLPGSPHRPAPQPVVYAPADCSHIHVAVEIALAAERRRRELLAEPTFRKCESAGCGTLLRRGKTGLCDPCKRREALERELERECTPAWMPVEAPAPAGLPHAAPCARDGCGKPVYGSACRIYCSDVCKQYVSNLKSRTKARAAEIAELERRYCVQAV